MGEGLLQNWTILGLISINFSFFLYIVKIQNGTYFLGC